VADLLHGNPSERRGLVTFVINPNREGFAQAFEKVTRGERPISLFGSLHEARLWLNREQLARQALTAAHNSPWNDPERQGILVRGQRRLSIPMAVRE